MKQFEFFQEVAALPDLRNQYRDLVKKWHPDRNQDRDTTKEMQKINAEYESLFEILVHQQGWSAERVQSEYDLDPILREKIREVINLKGIFIELCGNWIWVTGETKKFKEAFKKAGFFWARKKTAWYWRPSSYKRFGNREWSLSEIRHTYGSKVVKNALHDEDLALS